MGDLAMGRSNRKPAQSSLALLGQLLQSALPFEVFFLFPFSLSRLCYAVQSSLVTSLCFLS